MNKNRIAAIAIVVVVLAAGYAAARPATNGSFWNTGIASFVPGIGMMGNYGSQGSGMMGYDGGFGNGGGMMGYSDGSGMGGMMGYGGYGAGNGMGGMMGYSAGNGAACGMDDGYSSPGYSTSADPITIKEAKTAVEQYLESTGNPDLELAEIMEFSNHFYAGVKEKSTNIHAFELLVNKYTGAVTPEMGPNMMWNTKYGHMARGVTGTQEPTVTEEQALSNAQAYLDRVMPGTTVDEHADRFYGYYTIHTIEDGRIAGMLSVNIYTGAVWYHNWHGGFVDMLEVE
ncbi:MAG: hypothetical protein SCH70_08410 [Candidatus Methanoperedens sp.]|nr:hypothetical protein [Candidatus Methanoperedens sp.]